MDFESWAPKSSRIWRLRQWQGEEKAAEQREEEGKLDLDGLAARISQARVAGGSPVAEAEAESGPPSASSSFEDADDGAIADSLRRSIDMVAAGRSIDEEGEQRLTATELRELLYKKYGKSCDLSFVRRDLPGKAIVSLNVMWLHLEQRSFPLTEAAYMEKLEGVGLMLDLLKSTGRVRQFLHEPARARNGMPARPVVGTAVSIPLDLTPEQVEEWFGSGYQ